MSDPKTMLGERLRRLRLGRGFPTAREFSKRLGISENRYSRYERGETVPKVALQQAICRELGITPTELFGWTGDDDTGTRSQAGDGFSEPAAAFGRESPPASPADKLPGAAAWRLASTIAEASRRPDTGDRSVSTGPDLRLMREASEIYFQLLRDPYAVIAGYLQSVVPGAQSAEAEARIARDIERFLEAVGSDSNA